MNFFKDVNVSSNDIVEGTQIRVGCNLQAFTNGNKNTSIDNFFSVASSKNFERST